MSIVKKEFGEFVRKLDTLKYPRDNYPFSEALNYFDKIMSEVSRFTKNFEDPQVVYDEIKAYEWSLLKLKKDLVEYHKAKNGTDIEPQAVTLGKFTSLVIFQTPLIYDDNSHYYPTKDRIRSGYSGIQVESRLTYIWYNTTQLIDSLNKKTDDEDAINDIKILKEELLKLIRAFIDICYPNVASDFMYALSDFGDYYPHETVVNILESLIIRQGQLIAAGNKDVCYDSVTLENPFTILANNTCVDMLGIINGTSNFIDTTLGNSSAWSKNDIKRMFTNALIKSIGTDVLRPGNEDKRDFFIKVLRSVRKAVTAWINADANRTPTVPLFDILDMSEFGTFVYKIGINIGNIDEPISEMDEEIEQLKKTIKNLEEAVKDPNNPSPDEAEIEKAKSDLEIAETRRFKYLENKSLISFMFQEIFGNEKVVYDAFSMDALFYFVINKPGSQDNAMYDTWHLICTLIAKRDKMPNYVLSLNMHYIHYLEGDISSPEAKLFASILATAEHHQLPSWVAAAPIYNFETFEIAIRSIANTMSRTNEVINEEASIFLKNMDYYISNEMFSSVTDPNTGDTMPDFETLCTREKISEDDKAKFIPAFKAIYNNIENTRKALFGDHMDTPASCLCFLDEDTTKHMIDEIESSVDAIYNDAKGVYGSALDNIKRNVGMFRSAIDEYARNKFYYDYIIQRFGNINFNINSSESEAPGSWNRVINSDGHYPKNLWPYSQSYSYVNTVKSKDNAIRSEAELDADYMINVSADDIFKGKYGALKDKKTRFTRYNPLD